MNKWLRLTLIIAGSMFSLLIAGRLTGLVQVYKIPNAANLPNILKDENVIITKLKKPSSGDFIAFVNPYSDTLMAFTNRPSISQYVYRFCANEHDTVQMKNGVFYVNGNNIDTALNLAHFYLVQKKDGGLLSAVDASIAMDIYNDYRISDDYMIINMTDAVSRKVPAECVVKRYTQVPDTTQFGIFMWRNKNADRWTVDDFGPLVVPAGHCFVLGDNRSYALDSRYTGFIKLSNIKGVKF